MISRAGIAGILFSVLGIGIGSFSAGYIGAQREINDPVPYTDVSIKSVSQSGDGLGMLINFKKTDCVFNRIVVQGESLGIWDFVEFDSPPYGDRIKGWETLNILIKIKPDQFDRITIKTRHVCPHPSDDNADDIYVDKVFLTGSVRDWVSAYSKP